MLPSITAASPSELGVFLKSVDNKLYFGDIEQQTYKRISEIMNDQSQKDTYEISVPDYIYQKASFSENQIGNFLRFVDDEQEYRQILEEMKVKIDELQEEVIAELKKPAILRLRILTLRMTTIIMKRCASWMGLKMRG